MDNYLFCTLIRYHPKKFRNRISGYHPVIMAPNNSKYIDSRLDTLTEENASLRRDIEKIRECFAEFKSELEGLQFVVSENIERREAVESNLASVSSKCSSLETNLSSVKSQCSTLLDDQAVVRRAVEVQAQYSRISTLLLSGSAIPPYHQDENTLRGVLGLIWDHLGIEIDYSAIAACHRLRNKNTILVRFLNLSEREAVYRQRTKPLKQGLAIHESLTAERLAVVKTIKDIHKPKDRSPLDTFYTNRGRIFIKPRGAPGRWRLRLVPPGRISCLCAVVTLMVPLGGWARAL